MIAMIQNRQNAAADSPYCKCCDDNCAGIPIRLRRDRQVAVPVMGCDCQQGYQPREVKVKR